MIDGGYQVITGDQHGNQLRSVGDLGRSVGDRQRLVINRKDRHTLLSESALQQLRKNYMEYRRRTTYSKGEKVGSTWRNGAFRMYSSGR